MATEDLTFRFNVVGNAVPQFQQVQRQVKAVDSQIKRSTSTLRAHSNQYNRTSVATNKFAKGALQQAGFQIGDYAVQVANGTSAMQAFGQQGSQLLGIFGPVGAVLGAAVAIFSAVGVAAEKSGQEINNMGAALGVLQEPLSAAVSAVRELGSAFGNVFPVMLQNIDTALIAAGLFGGYMGVKYVASMLAATKMNGIFATSMATVRAAFLAGALGASRFNVLLGLVRGSALLAGAALKSVGAILMRFLPVAVLVGVAKLIEMFLALTKGVGGFGNALSLLGELFRETLSAMLQAAAHLPDGLKAVFETIKAGWMSMILFLQKKWADFLHSVSKSVKDMPGVPDFVKTFLGGEAILAGSKVYELEAAVNSLKDSAAGLRDEAAEGIVGSFEGVAEIVERLKQGVKDGTEDFTIFGDAAAAASEKAGGAAGKAADAIKNKMTEAQERIKSLSEGISKSFGDAFMSVVDGTKSAGDAFRDMARSIIKQLFDIFVVKQITGFIARGINTLFGGSPLAFGGPSFAGGGYTGSGSRSGGLDGKGGFMAMVHPRESIVDHTRGQSAGGQVVVNQTINVSTGVQQTVRTEIKSLMPQIAESAKSAVVDAKRRGGSYGRSFA